MVFKFSGLPSINARAAVACRRQSPTYSAQWLFSSPMNVAISLILHLDSIAVSQRLGTIGRSLTRIFNGVAV
jgi:hypothetical protein